MDKRYKSCIANEIIPKSQVAQEVLDNYYSHQRNNFIETPDLPVFNV